MARGSLRTGSGRLSRAHSLDVQDPVAVRVVPSRLEGFSWLLLAPVVAYVVSVATVTSDAVIAVHVTALVALGSMLFRGVNGHLFRAAFAWNVVWVFVIAAHYTSAHGVPFAGGGDDMFFFETSARLGAAWMAGDIGAHSRFSHFSGYGYLVLGGLLHIVSQPIGEVGPLVIRVWGAFAGASIGPAAYLLSRALAPTRPPAFHVGTAAVAGLFPILTFFSATGLRDIWLAAGATWFIAVVARARTTGAGPVLSWVAPSALLAATAFMRPESALGLVAFWVGLLYARRHTPGAKAASLLILAGTITLAVIFLDTIVAQLIRQQLSYVGAAAEAGPGSIGARILQIPPPAGYVARFIYAVVTPVPPMVAIRADTILIGIGATMWYFAVPLGVAGHRVVRKAGPELKAIADGIVLFAGVLLAGIALTSIDIRHKIPLIPVALVLAACALGGHSRRWRYDILMVVALIGAGLAAVYLILKS